MLGFILYLLQWLLLLFPTPNKSSQPKALLIKPFILGGKLNQWGLFLGKGQLGVVTIVEYNPKCLNLNGGAMYLVALSNYSVFQCSLVQQGLDTQARHLVASLSSQTKSFMLLSTPKKPHDLRLV